jgi:hypothetical protein
MTIKYHIQDGSESFFVSSFDKLINYIKNNRTCNASIYGHGSLLGDICYYRNGSFKTSRFMTNKQIRRIKQEFGTIEPKKERSVTKYQRLKKKKQVVANWKRMSRDQRTVYITTKANAIPSKASLQDRINYVVELLISLGCKDVIF